LHHKSQFLKHFGVLMVKKTLFALMFLCSYALVAIRSTKVYVRKNKSFLQNKPNFRKSQMNVNNVLTTNYDKMDTWSIGKNKPNTNPIQTQSKPKQTQYKAKQSQTKPISKAKNASAYED
jgi:hypothetical protein